MSDTIELLIFLFVISVGLLIFLLNMKLKSKD